MVIFCSWEEGKKKPEKVASTVCVSYNENEAKIEHCLGRLFLLSS